MMISDSGLLFWGHPVYRTTVCRLRMNWFLVDFPRHNDLCHWRHILSHHRTILPYLDVYAPLSVPRGGNWVTLWGREEGLGERRTWYS